MKLDHHNIEEMMKMIQKYQLEEISYEGEQGQIHIQAAKKTVPFVTSSEEPKVEACTIDSQNEYIVSEGIGRYYFIDENGKKYLEVGQTIKVGMTIGMVSSIGISTPLISKQAGVVEEILVPNGDIIDYGKKIIKIRI